MSKASKGISARTATVETTEYLTGNFAGINLAPVAGSVELYDASNVLVGTFTTIQAAITAAGTGYTILIGDGLYTEQLNVNGKTDLTIRAFNNGQVTVLSPDVLALNGHSDHFGADVRAVIAVNDSTNVTIRGLIVDGSFSGDTTPGSNGDEISGIGYFRSSGAIDGVAIVNVGNSPGGGLFGLQHGSGLFIDGEGGSGLAVSVTDSEISNFQKTGVLVFGVVLTFTGNAITGIGGTGLIAQNGLQIGNAQGVIDGNVISGFGYSGGTYYSSGIIAYEPTGPLSITDNEITGAGGAGSSVGIDLSDVGNVAVVIGDNSFDALDYGVYAYTYTGGGLGLGTAPVLSDNSFTNIGVEGLHIDPEESYGAGFTTSSPFNLTGTGGNDTLAGSAGTDSLDGAGGNDTLTGRGGNDSITGGSGTDTAVVGSGATFTTNGSSWTVTSSDGTDTLSGVEIVSSGSAHTLLVGAGGFATIQAAVNAAQDGDTILVASGTYIEQVVVDGFDNLTIRAADGATVTIQAPLDVHQTATSSSGRAVNAVVTVLNGTNVVFDNINIDGAGHGNTVDGTNANFIGVFYRNASGTLLGVDIGAIREPYVSGTTVSGNQRGVGLQVDNSSLLAFTMTGGSIFDFQKNATVFNYAILSITGVTVTGGGAQTINAQNGFQVSNSTGSISGNTITGIGFAGAPGTYSAGVLAFGNTNLDILGNIVTGANGTTLGAQVVGIYVLDFGTPNSGGTISGNTISYVDTGIAVYGNIQPNGITVGANSVTNIDTTDPYAAGVDFEPNPGLAAAFDVTGTAADDILYGAAGNDNLKGLGGNDDLRGNGGDDTLTGGAGDGDTAIYAGPRADYIVSYTTDANGRVTGFTSVADNNGAVNGDEGTDTLSGIEALQFSNQVLNLGDPVQLFDASGNLVGTFATIQAAINAASANYRIEVAAGTYNENLNVNKDITIDGPNEGVAGTGARGAEAIINGLVSIIADGVTLNGLTILNGAPLFGQDVTAIYVSTDNVTLTNLILDGPDGGYGIQTPYGGGATGLILSNSLVTGWDAGAYFNPSTGFTATGNSFDGNGNGFVGDDWAAGTFIDNNSFTNSGGSHVGYGSLDSVEDVQTYFGSGNTFEAPNRPVSIFAYGAPGGQEISGTEESNRITGEYASGSGDSTFHGRGGDDLLQGFGGNDVLDGGAGNDTLEGGSGTDTAFYAGDYADYGVTLVTNAKGLVTGVTAVTDTNASGLDEGTDSLTTMEVLQFNDVTLNLTHPVQLFDTGGNLIGTFATIQGAVDASTAGYTIRIAAGTYTENVNFHTAVTVLGAHSGEGGATRTGSAAAGETTLIGRHDITAATGAVTLDGLRFLNNGSTTGAAPDAILQILTGGGHVVTNSVFYSEVQGGNRPSPDDRAISMPVIGDGQITISNNYFTGAFTGGFGTASWGRAVWFDGGGVDLSVTGNTIEYSRTGLNLDMSGDSQVAVSDNHFTTTGTAVAVGVDMVGLTFLNNDFTNAGEEFNFRNQTLAVTFDAELAVDAQSGDFINVLGGQGGDTLYGTSTSDLLDGNQLNPGAADNDALDGRGGGDVLFGRGGDDTLTGGTGNDFLFGGSNLGDAGYDSAVFSGNMADYAITVLGGGVIEFVDTRPGSPDGTDQLSGIERVVFADDDYTLNPDGTLTLINFAPTAVDDVNSATEDGATVTGSVATNDSDPDVGETATLTYAFTGPVPAGLTMTGSNGSYSFDPGDSAYDHIAQGATQIVVASYTVTDDHGASDVGTLTITVTGTNDAPVVTGGPATGSVTEAISLDGIPGADQTANNRLEPVVNYDSAIVSLLAAHPNDMHAVLVGLQAQLPSGSGIAEAIAIVWDYVDDNFSYYNTVINEISARLSVEYALYLQGGGLPLTGTAAKYTPDGGDVGTAPDRYQSLHDNILGNVNGAGLTDKFLGAGGGGSNPNPDQAAYDRIIALLNANGLGDLVNRPVYSGTEGAPNFSLAYDQTHGLLAPATGGLLTATDVDDGAVLAWSGSATGIYGAFSIATNGAWTYALDQFDPDTQALAAGTSAVETFTATVSDGLGGTATQLVTITVFGTNDAPVVTSGPAAASGSITEAVSLSNLRPAGPAGGLEPSVNYDAQIVSLLTAHPDNMPAVLADLQALLPAGSNSLADAIAVMWDYVDDHYNYYDTVINEVSARLSVEYARYLLNGGDPLTGVTAKYTADGGDLGSAPDRLQSLHDNLLGNLSAAGLNDKFRGPPNGSNPTPDEAAYNQIIALLASHGLSDLLNRPYYGGGEGDNAAPTLAFDQAHGFVEMTGGTLTASDVDTGAVLTWSGSAVGTYGSFAITAGGVWTYTLNDVDPDTQALAQGVVVTETFTATVSDGLGGSSSQLVTINITGTNDVPVVTNGPGAASGSVTEGFSPNNLTPAGAAGGLDPAVNYDGQIVSLLAAHPDNMPAVLAGIQALLPAGSNGLVNAIAVMWDYVDDHYSYYDTVINEISGRLSAEYARYLVLGGAPLIGTVAKYAPDGGDGGANPDRQQSLHDNLLGNLSLAGLNDKLRGPPNGSNPNPDESAYAQIIALLASYGLSDVVNRPYFGGYEGDANLATAYDQANGLLPPATGGQLTASDVDTDAVLTWSGSATGVYGGFAIGANGAWTYTLDNFDPDTQALAAGTSAVETFTATVTDNHGATATQVVTVIVHGTNDAPVAVADINSGTEDGAPVTGSVATNDSDVDTGASLSYALASPVAGLTLNTNGGYSFDPGDSAYDHIALGATQVVTANYIVSDANGGSSTSTLTITVTGINDAPVITNGPGAASGSVNEGISPNNLTPAGAAGGLEPAVNYDGQIVSLLAAHPDNMPAVLAGIQALLPAGSNGLVNAIAVMWDYVDDHYSYYDTVINEISGRLSAEYARYLVLGGAPLIGTVAKYAPDGGDGGANPDRQQSLHDNLLGNLSLAGLNDKLRGPPNGSNPNPDESAYAQIIALLASYGLSDVVNRPYFGGYEGDANLATAYDQANGLLPPATGGQLTASDVDDDAVLTWSGTGTSVYGAFAITAGGAWTYNLDNFDADTQALAAGTSAVETFTATVTDNHGATATQVVTVIVHGTNDAPIAVADVNAGTEDGALVTGTVAGNDSDVDTGAVLSYALAAPVAGLTINPNGSYSFDPGDAAYDHIALGATQVVTANYIVSDANGGSSTSTLTITVTGINDAPDAVNDIASAIEDGAVVLGSVAGNDTDIDDGATRSWALVAPVAGLTLDSAGNYVFNPLDPAYQHIAAGATQTVVASYRVTDQHGATDIATLTITVAGTNDAPDAANDVNGAAEDGAIVTGNVGSNDSDVDDGATRTFALVAAPPAGLTFNPDGSYSFNPSNAAYQHLAVGATDTLVISYTISDGSATDTATLTITVNGTNDAPVAADDVNTAIEDGAVVTGTVATGDTDVDDGATRTYALSGSVAGLTINSDGSYSFDPASYDSIAAGDTQIVTATYIVTDDHGATDTGTLTITVSGINDAPDAVNDTASAVEDGAVVTGTVATNDTDADIGDTRTYTLNAPVAGLTLNGNGSYSFNPVNAAYQHLALGATQTVVATYTFADNNGESDTATLTITVTGTNDAPDAVADTIIATEDGPVVSGSLGVNDTDADDGATRTYLLVAPVTGLTLTPSGNYTFDPSSYDSIAAGSSVTLTTSYRVIDNNGATDTATISITIHGINDAPDAVNDVATAIEDGAIVTGNVSFNDVDVDSGDSRTYAQFGVVAGLTINSDGSYSFDPSDPAYQHIRLGATEVVVATYTMTDGAGVTDTATLTITVNGRNDAPLALFDLATASEDGAIITGNVGDNDVDVDDGAARGFIPTGPVPAGLTFNPDGSYSFDPSDAAYQHLAAGVTEAVILSYRITDQHGATGNSTLTITVTGTNDGPIAADDVDTAIEDGAVVTGNVGAGDTDADDGAILTYALNGTVPGLTIAANGDYSFDPSNAAYQHLAQGATDTIVATYTVTDQFGATDTATLTITVAGANDAPVALDDSRAVNEDGGTITGNVGGNDTDADDGATRSFTAVGPVPAGLIFSADGSYSFNPSDSAYQHLALGVTQAVTLTYTIDDGLGATDTATLTITVTGVNDAPDAVNDVASATEDGAVVTGTVATNDSDADAGDTRTYALVAPVTGLTLGSNGSYSFDPSSYDSLAFGVTQNVVATYTLTDGQGVTDTATLTITVTGVNDAPDAVNDVASATEDGATVTGTVATNDSDADAGDTRTYALVAPVAGLTLDSNGSYSFDPSSYDSLAAGATQIVVATYTLTDGQSATDTATLTITVTGINDAPDAVNDVAGATEDGAIVTGTVATNDSDADAGDTRTYALVAPVTGLTFGSNGSYSFDPSSYDSLAFGATQIVVATYTLTDGQGVTDTATLTITVTGVNDAPDAVNDVAAATEDGATVTGTVATNDSDVDASDTRTYALAAPVAGLTLDSNGSYSFDPSSYDSLAFGATQNVVATYTMTDGQGATDTATLTITVTGVNDAPDAVNDVASATEGGAVVTGSVATNDSDVDAGDTRTYTLNTPMVGLMLGSTGNYAFVPTSYHSLAAGATQNLVATYTMTDGQGATDTATLTITITGVNDGPDAVNDVASATEDGATVTGTVATNDTDADIGDTRTYTLSAPVAGLTMDSNGSYIFDPSSYDSLAAGATQNVVATYIMTDGQGATDTATLTITVTGVDDAPVARPDAFVINEATILSGNLLADNGSGADVDVDGPAPTISAVNGLAGNVGVQITLASGALLTVNANGTFTYNPNGVFNTTPAANSGASNLTVPDSFTYTLAGGGTATVSLTITGLDTNDILFGTAGADALNGGAGLDIMIGLGGSDTYYIDNVGDQVLEANGQGFDAIYTSVSYALTGGVELEWLSAAAVGGTGAINLTGNEFANYVLGNNGVNILDGGGGSDVLVGYGGNDVYYVDSPSDFVIESVGGGFDAVYTSTNYTLSIGAEVEWLSTAATYATDTRSLTGNEYANTILGNQGVNVLDGAGGADVLVGYGGNDTYYVDSTADFVIENAGGGFDAVYTSASYTLFAGAEVEWLATTATYATTALSLTGNEIANIILGNDGANVINGAGGADVLVGYGGADTFAFTTALGAGNVDMIIDFAAGTDKIGLDDAVFTAIGGLGPLNANAFVIGGAAADASDRIIYNSTTGELFYDSDGLGGAAQILFATLNQGLSLTASDFQVI